MAIALAVMPLWLIAPDAAADVYKFVDKNGVVHLTDRPLGPGYKLILRTKRRSPPSNYSKNRKRYTPMINEMARRAQLDRALVHAVVTAESAYNPGAVSKAGAVGLMQLMPGTAKRYGVRDRRDPAQNVWGGVRYLRDLLEQFNDLSLALAAYNAGENAVIKYGRKIPPYPETQQYVKRVLQYYRRHRRTS
ncbi:MAG: lytic transglycosylase domain-containing protein [Pseudomonadota bacterium]